MATRHTLSTVAITLQLMALLALSPAHGADFVKYIEAARVNGGSHFVTDYTPSAGAVVEADVSWDSPSIGGVLFCSCGSNIGTASYALSFRAGYGWQFNYNAWSPDSVAVGIGSRHTVKCAPDGIYVDGEKKANRTPLDFSPANKLVVFSAYSGNLTGFNSKAYATLYSLKAYEPDGEGGLSLALDLVPCLCDNGLVQLYDRVSGAVVENAATQFPVAPQITVPAVAGVGDAEALAEAFKCVNDAGASKAATTYMHARIFLEPGIYDVSGCAMDTASHLAMKPCGGAQIVGLGANPGETVIAGGGQGSGRRVLYLEGGSTPEHMVVSNVTVTGGYIASASGGGVSAKALITSVDCFDCIISNNIALQGGGQYSGFAYNCNFENNGCLKSGGAAVSVEASGCRFSENRCGLSMKYGGGGAMYLGKATGCVFENNHDGDDGGQFMYGSVSYQTQLADCTITNSKALRRLVCEGAIDRCRFTRCGKSASNGAVGFSAVGKYAGSSAVQIANTVFTGISAGDEADRVATDALLVNCTIRGATCPPGGMAIDSTVVAVNTLAADCTPCAVSAASAPTMTNCLWTTQSGELPAGAATGGGLVPSIRFTRSGDNCDIQAASPARDAALDDAWVASLVGDLDCAGRPRRRFGGLDIGAMECQSDRLAPTCVLMR